MHKRSLLIVDKDPDVKARLEPLFKAEGFHIAAVDSGEDALHHCRHAPTDIVIMTIELGGSLSGTETALAIKQLRPDCRIVFLTQHTEKEAIAEAARSKPVAYLLKPCRPVELVATVEMALANHTETFTKTLVDQIPLPYGFVYDASEKRLLKNGQTVKLTPKKLALIALLAGNRGHIVTHDHALKLLGYSDNSGGSLRALISRLNAELGFPLVTNVKGVGYMIERDEGVASFSSPE